MALEAHSLALQKQIVGIVKMLLFNPDTSDEKISQVINHFREKDGAISKSVPAAFLSDEEYEAVFDTSNKFEVWQLNV